MRNLFGLSLAVVLLAACAVLPVKPPEPGTEPPAAVSPSVVSPADRAYASGAASLEAGNCEAALDLFSEAWKESPGHPGAAKGFAQALERLKRKGDEAARRGRTVEAGNSWTATLRYMSHPAAKGKVFPFTQSEVRASLDKMSDALLEKGLIEYRDGRIESAIAHWQTILAYDPSHAEAAKSVQTATTQLENLKKITPPPPAK